MRSTPGKRTPSHVFRKHTDTPPCIALRRQVTVYSAGLSETYGECHGRYYSPYPEPWGSQQQLWVCEFDMLYFKNPVALDKHLVNVTRRSPPGALCMPPFIRLTCRDAVDGCT